LFGLPLQFNFSLLNRVKFFYGCRSLNLLFDLGHELFIKLDKLCGRILDLVIVQHLHIVHVELRLLRQLLPEGNLRLSQVAEVLDLPADIPELFLDWL
jgi:hypothetical protein